jgi:hypothetical protein
MKLAASFATFVLILITAARAADDAKTYKPDADGYIRNWLLLDPVKLTENIADHTEDQEKPVFAKDWVKSDHNPKAGDKLKADGKEYPWSAKESSDSIVDFTQIFADKDHDQCIFLGVAYIVADKDIDDVKLSIGSDDSSVWKLNGKEVIRIYAGRDCEKDTDKSPSLTLKKGVNVVEFAVTQGDGPTAAVARFVDKDDKPVKDVTISLAPPNK